MTTQHIELELGWARGCVGVDELASAVTEMKKEGGARHGHMNPASMYSRQTSKAGKIEGGSGKV